MSLPTSIIREVQGTTANDWANHHDLNWEAEKTPLVYFPRDGISRDSSMVALTRSDTGQELGVVSPRYQIVQPRDILEGFEEATHNLGAGFKMDGVGIYGDGKIIWGRAKSEETIRIMGQDSLESYLYMVTSFDGSTATMGFVSTLRTICSNALHLAQKKGDKLFSLSHRSKYRGEATSALDTYMGTLGEFEQNANRLAQTRVGPNEAIHYLTNLLYPGRSKESFKPRELTTLQKYASAIDNSPGSNLTSVAANADGVSAWGLLNAVTYIVDNDPVRSVGSEESQSKSKFMGAGNNLKNKAWEHAMRLAA